MHSPGKHDSYFYIHSFTMVPVKAVPTASFGTGTSDCTPSPSFTMGNMQVDAFVLEVESPGPRSPYAYKENDAQGALQHISQAPPLASDVPQETACSTPCKDSANQNPSAGALLGPAPLLAQDCGVNVHQAF